MPLGEVQVDAARAPRGERGAGRRPRPPARPRSDSGVGVMPDREHRELGVDAGDGAAVRRARGERPAEVAELHRQQRRVHRRAGRRQRRLHRLGGQAGEQHAVARRPAPDRAGPCAAGRARWSAIVANVSIAGPSARSGASSSSASSCGSRHDGLDDHERLAAQERRQVGDRREAQHPADRRHLVRHRPHPLAPRVQHLGARARCGKNRTPAYTSVNSEQPELDRRHDAEAAAAAAQRPEELGLVRRRRRGGARRRR